MTNHNKKHDQPQQPNSSSSCSSFQRRGECCISHRFWETASANADKTALIHASHLSFSFSRLLAAVHSLASRLRSSSPAPNVVGIYAPPSADYVAAALAALRLGVPFLPLDPSWPTPRLLSAIASSAAGIVLATNSRFGSHWIASAGDFRVLWFSAEEESAGGGDALEDLDWPCQSDDERLFSYVIYTSGSTGKPKAICGTEQGLLNRFLWMQELYPLSGDDVLLFKTPVSFVDHLQEFLGAVLAGCTLVIPPFNELKRNLFSIVNFIQDYSITRLTAVPSLMRAILPGLESHRETNVLSSLKLLVLSGEVFTLSLFDRISKTLPGTTILNLYGSTEVSGDCTYFDCKRLPVILASETLVSVPIGVPIANCDVVLVGADDDLPSHGEIYVSGVCNSAGYLHDSKFMSLDCEKLPKSCVTSGSSDEHCVYFRTGDYARRLQSGNLVFLGRKDRTIKVNGQWVALDEIEDVLSGHPYVESSAVIYHKFQIEGVISLVAFVILKKEKPNEIRNSHIKSWMAEKIPSAMLPNIFVLGKAFPTTSSGKVDYEILLSEFLQMRMEEDNLDVTNTQLLQFIKKAFCDALTIEEVSDDDDFFLMGGNSIAAAHLSHKLGVDMRLIYQFSTPSKLCTTFHASRLSNLDLMEDANPYSEDIEYRLQLSRTHSRESENSGVSAKRFKLDTKINDTEEGLSLLNGSPWTTTFEFLICSFSRCNKVIYGGDDRLKHAFHEKCAELPRNSKVSMQQLWKVHMGSCIDASPLILFKGSEVYLFIGSHSHEFMCINARSGYVQWKMQLEGRIECSAAILAESSQVIVGCYEGKLYFIDTLVGKVCWTFQTSGEVKSQPVVDSKRQLIWCGSHDHHLYALDYIHHCCVYKVHCAGSIFGSPMIDEVNDILYVASTSGRITAIYIKDSAFEIMWLHELETPVFGSLAMSSHTGYIICCLVDGRVVSLDSNGSVMWKHRTSGPIFAGACISHALPSQVLICSRNGSIFSFQAENGKMLWEYNVGDPITSSAYVDEHLCFTSDLTSVSADRMVCVCSSSGRVVLLQVSSDVTKESEVTEIAGVELKGDVFSSPVMVGGRIFVGCRDDFVHCLAVNMSKNTSN